MKGAILVTLAGVWILTQVFGGDALGRLGIAGAPVVKAASSAGPGNTFGGPTFVPSPPVPA